MWDLHLTQWLRSYQHAYELQGLNYGAFETAITQVLKRHQIKNAIKFYRKYKYIGVLVLVDIHE